jgi:hypothetical protein
VRFEKSEKFIQMIAEETFLDDRVKFSVGTLSPAQPLQGQGAFGTIYFEVLQETSSTTSIRYGPTTFVGDLETKVTNALLGVTPLSLTVRNPIISSTPTRTPTFTNTPTATQTPTITIVLTPTPVIPNAPQFFSLLPQELREFLELLYINVCVFNVETNLGRLLRGIAVCPSQ